MESRKESIFIRELSHGVSRARLESYRLPGEPDEILLSRYLWNIGLAESFLPVLQSMEVALRNALHGALTAECGGKFWGEHPPQLLHARDSQMIEEAKGSLMARRCMTTPDRIVAELQFGFWTGLLTSRYEANSRNPPCHWLWPRLLKTTFPGVPKRCRTLGELARRLNDARQLRNRIYHNEPIWRTADLPKRHREMMETVLWLNPELHALTDLIDRFADTFSAGELVHVAEVKRLLR